VSQSHTGEGPRALEDRQIRIPAGHALHGAMRIAAGVGAAGIAATGVMALLEDEHANATAFSWLTAFAFWLAVGLGALFFVLVQHITRAGWSVALRRVAENLMMALPVVAVVGLTGLIVGASDLYEWTHQHVVAEDETLSGKAAFLNFGWFIAWSAGFIVLWSWLATFNYRQSVLQDDTGQLEHSHRLRWWAPVGVIVFALSLTFAAVYWLMSLDPHWYSTIYGVYYFAGAFMSGTAVLILMCQWLQKHGFLVGVVSTEHYHDLGKLMFAFMVFWTYIAFSQFFLIWYANIPEETIWFEYRWTGSWMWLSLLLLVLHFAVPFFFLMSRHVKRDGRLLRIGALLMLAAQYVDMFWLVKPFNAHHHAMEKATEAAAPLAPTLDAILYANHGLSVHLADLFAFVGIGGIFVATFLNFALRRALVPIKDPRLQESLAFENV
jgi:hypothetical protein